MAIKLIIRHKNLFLNKLKIMVPKKETKTVINDVTIEAFPSHHVD